MEELSGAATALLAGTLPATSHGARHTRTEKPAHRNTRQQNQLRAHVHTSGKPTGAGCPHVPAAATHPLLGRHHPPQRRSWGSRSPNGPRVRASPLPCDKADAHPVAWPPWRKGTPSAEAVALFGDKQPRGTAWQERERQLLDAQVAATASTRGCAGGTVPPSGRVLPPRHPSLRARGTVLGSGATLGASNPGSTLALPAQSRRRSPCTSWAISQSLVSGGGQGHGILHSRSSRHASGLRTAARGGGVLPDLPGEPWGRRVSAFPQGNHQRKTL